MVKLAVKVMVALLIFIVAMSVVLPPLPGYPVLGDQLALVVQLPDAPPAHRYVVAALALLAPTNKITTTKIKNIRLFKTQRIKLFQVLC